MQQPPPLTFGAWIYPGPPACSASAEIADGRIIDVLKPQYYTLRDDGTLVQQTDRECNGYSPANVALVKAHSQQQFVTISGSILGIATLALDAHLLSACSKTLLSFLQMSGFTGVEFDVEDFASWTPEQYSAYKHVMMTLGTTLHSASFQLMLDGPAISTVIEQGYYPWKYEDFDHLPVDYVVVMAYDLQYDNGSGTPVQPLLWLQDICAWMKSKITDPQRIVIGLPSYGYHGVKGGYAIVRDTYEESSHYPGFATATRDGSSGEMMWTVGNMFYDYSDSTTLNGRVAVVSNAGLSHVSVWHLGGGNQWFRPAAQTAEPVSPTQGSMLSAFAAAFTMLYPGFDVWYHTHFTQGEYHD